MNNKMRNVATGLAGILSVFLLAMTLVACSTGKPVLAGCWIDDTYVVEANAAADKDILMATYDVEEGTTSLGITSDIDSGVLHVALVEGDTEQLGEDATIGELVKSTESDLENDGNASTVDAQGKATTTIEVEPGTYSLVMVGDEASPATGTVTIAPAK